MCTGIVVSSVSRQEISLNLQPGQQVMLAGYTFRFERLDLQAKGNYTSEKAIVALFDHQQRIGELTPEQRLRSTSSANDRTVEFAGTASTTGMRSWVKKPERIVTLFVCMYKAVCAGSGGEDC
ncbi:cytochrome c-type biogenesis CcmF C-terminal domain-containing protein [Escherichia coli]